MNFGFLIDNSACIGCHACSTACKSENAVPLGVNRTWVKTVETGAFPDSRRSFQVTRCNHCANPPCVRICPTGAMNQRDDGIVEFDSDACIGCKACTQACPYDAIHMDPDTHTAAKCHMCSHRVDVGLEPACVVVCPEHAIVFGDLDDAGSEISQKLAKNNVSVRRPEQGTAPKTFYIQGAAAALHPSEPPAAHGFSWADTISHHGAEPGISPPAPRPTTTRGAQPQGLPGTAPMDVGGRMAEQLMRVTYNAQHDIQWHWPIPAYLVTKHIAGGTFAFLAIAALAPQLPFSPIAMVLAGGLAVLMTLVTLALLVYDLDRPDRFFYLLLRPQWRSWVARAAWILTAFSMVTGLWWGLETGAWLGWWADPGRLVRNAFALASLPLGIAAAIYTAFLFAQCEGRDLWQGSHLPAQMSLHAIILGAAPILALGAFTALPPALLTLAWWAVMLGLLASAAVTLMGDVWTPAASEAARRATRELTAGRYRKHFWTGGMLLGHAVPLVLVGTGQLLLAPIALLCIAFGLFAWGYGLVMAPQEIPNS